MLLLLQCQAGLAPVAWIRLVAPDLVLLTTGEAQVAEEAVAELAGLRSDWRAATPPGQWEERRLRIVAFSSEAEYLPFRVNAFSPAYFTSGIKQNTIVLGRLTKQSFPALRHEYVHHLVRARWRRLPLWLEEGLADYYGGVDDYVAQARADRLRQGGLLPLSQLALMTKSSAGYQQREAARQFYAQSWALVHLLMTAPAYHAEAWACVDRLNTGESLQNAVEWAFHRGLQQLEADLGGHLGSLKIKVAASRPSERAAVASIANAEEVGLALARLLLRKGDTGGAQRYLDLLPDSSRDNPERWSLSADLALQQGRPFDARSALLEALRLGTGHARGVAQLALLEGELARLMDMDPAEDKARQARRSIDAIVK